MTVISKPFSSKPPKKKALLVAIRHVNRKAESTFGNLADLEFAHRDAEQLRKSLITSHGYQENDIILMKDDKDHPKHLWPTQKNILHQIDLLTSEAPEDCHFFFYYSGHGLEVDVDSPDRASQRVDGREDEILSADGKPILDYILHNRLIEPLRKVKGSKLFALFDCCHSETLLDLQKGSGPNRYSRAWDVGPGQLFKDVATVVANLSKLNKKRKHDDVVPALASASASASASAPASAPASASAPAPAPAPRPATRRRSTPMYKTEEVGELSVICLSACRDKQLAHDDCDQGLTFTKCFLNAMEEKPNITWTELRDALKEFISEIRTSYEAYIQESSSESDVTHESWTQEPRLCTSSHTDLTRVVSY